MRIEFLSIIIGLIFSLPYGLGSWFNWQSMKKDTILPFGSFTVKYGNIVSFFIKSISIIIIIIYISYWGILSVIIMYFIGNWIATLIERKLYCNEYLMDLIVYAAQEYSEDLGSEGAAQIMEKVAPKWWIKLMPLKWQKNLRVRLVPILLPNEKEQI